MTTYDDWKTTDPTQYGEPCASCGDENATKCGRIWLCEACEQLEQEPEYEYQDREP